MAFSAFPSFSKKFTALQRVDNLKTTVMLKGTGLQKQMEKPRKGIFGDSWCRHCEEETFLRYLGPYFARAALESRVDEFLGQAFHLWVDRFPVTHAPDTEPEAVLWALEVERKRFHKKIRWMGTVYSKKPAPLAWDAEMALPADRARRCTEFLAVDRWGIKLEGYQFQVAAEEKGLKARTFEEIEQDFLEEIEKDSFLECCLYWLELV